METSPKSPIEPDPNRIIRYQCQIELLDAKYPNGMSFSVYAWGLTPEEAYERAIKEAREFERNAKRLCGDEP